MKKDALRELAVVGAQQRVAAIERELNEYQREFPDIFISTDRPLLLKAELRRGLHNGNGNGTPPRHAPNPKLSLAMKKIWTPKRRAEQAARMQKQQASIQAARHPGSKKRGSKQKNLKGKKTGKKTPLWMTRWHARLLEHGAEHIGESAKALKTTSATLLTSGVRFLRDGTIVKKGPGLYSVGKELPSEHA